MKHQQSIKIINEIGLNEPDNILDSFDIYSTMFDQILLKININLGQIISMTSKLLDAKEFSK